MIILCDYDGTVTWQLPEPGFSQTPVPRVEEVLRKLIRRGHNLVLWTSRNNSRNNPFNYINGQWREETSLEEAVRWFKERNILLSGINSYPNEESNIGTSRKLLGDVLIDNTAIGTPLICQDVQYVAFDTGEIKTEKSICVDWVKLEDYLKQYGIL